MRRSAPLVLIAAALVMVVTGCTDDRAMPGLGEPVANPTSAPSTTTDRTPGWEMVVLATSAVVMAARRLDTAGGAPGPALPVGQLGPIAVFVVAVGVPAGQVTDTVTTPDVAILGDAPAAPMSDLYGTIGASLGLAAVNAQQQPSLYRSATDATTNQSVPLIYSVDTVGRPGVTIPGSTLPSSLESIMSVVEALKNSADGN